MFLIATFVFIDAADTAYGGNVEADTGGVERESGDAR